MAQHVRKRQYKYDVVSNSPEDGVDNISPRGMIYDEFGTTFLDDFWSSAENSFLDRFYPNRTEEDRAEFEALICHVSAMCEDASAEQDCPRQHYFTRIPLSLH